MGRLEKLKIRSRRLHSLKYRNLYLYKDGKISYRELQRTHKNWLKCCRLWAEEVRKGINWVEY